MPQTKVGPFILLETIGNGSFGKVKHAIDERSGKSYAVKIFDKETIRSKFLTLQVRREISVMTTLRHERIVRLYQVITTKTHVYIIMELVTGGELYDEILRWRRLPESLARVYFQQLVQALEHCHSKGIYHRDLKPENILLDETGAVKISDFGLSSLKGTDLLHTQCGTPHYVAPEIINASQEGYSGSKVDLWSCGVILFVLLTGYLPFDADDPDTLFKKILNCDLAYPHYLTTESKHLISCLLRLDPKQRYGFDEIRAHPWYHNESLVESSQFDKESRALASKYNIYDDTQFVALVSQHIGDNNCYDPNCNICELISPTKYLHTDATEPSEHNLPPYHESDDTEEKLDSPIQSKTPLPPPTYLAMTQDPNLNISFLPPEQLSTQDCRILREEDEQNVISTDEHLAAKIGPTELHLPAHGQQPSTVLKNVQSSSNMPAQNEYINSTKQNQSQNQNQNESKPNSASPTISSKKSMLKKTFLIGTNRSTQSNGSNPIFLSLRRIQTSLALSKPKASKENKESRTPVRGTKAVNLAVANKVQKDSTLAVTRKDTQPHASAQTSTANQESVPGKDKIDSNCTEANQNSDVFQYETLEYNSKEKLALSEDHTRYAQLTQDQKEKFDVDVLVSTNADDQASKVELQCEVLTERKSTIDFENIYKHFEIGDINTLSDPKGERALVNQRPLNTSEELKSKMSIFEFNFQDKQEESLPKKEISQSISSDMKSKLSLFENIREDNILEFRSDSYSKREEGELVSDLLKLKLSVFENPDQHGQKASEVVEEKKQTVYDVPSKIVSRLTTEFEKVSVEDKSFPSLSFGEKLSDRLESSRKIFEQEDNSSPLPMRKASQLMEEVDTNDVDEYSSSDDELRSVEDGIIEEIIVEGIPSSSTNMNAGRYEVTNVDADVGPKYPDVLTDPFRLERPLSPRQKRPPLISSSGKPPLASASTVNGGHELAGYLFNGQNDILENVNAPWVRPSNEISFFRDRSLPSARESRENTSVVAPRRRSRNLLLSSEIFLEDPYRSQSFNSGSEAHVIWDTNVSPLLRDPKDVLRDPLRYQVSPQFPDRHRAQKAIKSMMPSMHMMSTFSTPETAISFDDEKILRDPSRYAMPNRIKPVEINDQPSTQDEEFVPLNYPLSSAKSPDIPNLDGTQKNMFAYVIRRRKPLLMKRFTQFSSISPPLRSLNNIIIILQDLNWNYTVKHVGLEMYKVKANGVMGKSMIFVVILLYELDNGLCTISFRKSRAGRGRFDQQEFSNFYEQMYKRFCLLTEVV